MANVGAGYRYRAFGVTNRLLGYANRL
jgi:hypothetical protein